MADQSTMTAKDYVRAFDTLDALIGIIEAARLNKSAARKKEGTIPVVIVAGFPGAGKTTLVRHVLNSDHGLTIAALVHYFAALNIDAALIADVTEDTTALANGCICCSLSSGVAQSLAQIAARPATVDAIMIEASGVSDPAGIAQVAHSVDQIALDCIVAVVDAAETTLGKPDHDYLLERQVSGANLILVNKTDLVSKEEAERTVGAVAKLAPKAQILRASHCAVPTSVIFDSYDTLMLVAPHPVARGNVEACLAALPEGILRMKGFLWLSDAPESPILLQAVGRRWTWHSAPHAEIDTGLVVIGKSESIRASKPDGLFERMGFSLQDNQS